MTIIAWDGTTLAADKRAIYGDSAIRTTTKIFSIDGALVGYAGQADVAEEVLTWFRSGRDPAAYPTIQRDKDFWATVLVVWPDKEIWTYERTPSPVKFCPQTFAVGSGRDYAMTAMYLGKTAAEAVEIASLFDSSCGNGIDTLTHESAA